MAKLNAVKPEEIYVKIMDLLGDLDLRRIISVDIRDDFHIDAHDFQKRRLVIDIEMLA